MIELALRRFDRWVSRLRVLWHRLATDGLAWSSAGYCGRRCRFVTSDGGRIDIGSGSSIQDAARLHCRAGVIRIGKDSHIGFGTILAARQSINIGDNVLIGEYVVIRDQDHLPSRTKDGSSDGFIAATVSIDDGVWIGAKATITRGVKVGAGSVVAANAVVTKDVPPGVLVAGVPAGIVKSL